MRYKGHAEIMLALGTVSRSPYHPAVIKMERRPFRVGSVDKFNQISGKAVKV